MIASTSSHPVRLSMVASCSGSSAQSSSVSSHHSSGLKPREVAKLLKVPIGLVQAVAKDE
ncbi:MAG: hypothetical protein IH905_14815 [Proteobacteria bacterium]|nr:hypothetical protein [Pseudomonadota bacterium]